MANVRDFPGGAPEYDTTPSSDEEARSKGAQKQGARGDKESLLHKIDPEEARRMAAFWKDQVKAVDEAQQRWVKRCDQICKRYRDERNRVDEEGQRRMNILWATIQTLHPALYGRCPQPIAERRFLDKDPIARVASQILERTLRNEIDNSEYDESISSAVLDYLLVGRGQVWVRYEPLIGASASLMDAPELDMRDAQGEIEKPDEREETRKLEETGEEVVAESTPVDYILWKDFYMFPARARRWSEVQAVGKRVYMSRSEMIDRFGEDIGKRIGMTYTEAERVNLGEITSMHDRESRKGEVYEIWNKSDRRLYWIAENFDTLCDLREDPLNLARFYPCPRPLTGTSTNDTVIPVPDFMEWQDQAIMVDELTQRISMLSKACKIAGVYAASEFAVRRLLDESVENELIPVDDWAAFAEKGGVEGVVSYMPVKDIINVLNELVQVRQQVLKDLDQVTGISDIMRGTTDSRETLGAQRIKANYSTVRLTKRQKDVARFARDTIRIMAEIIEEQFAEETLIEVSGCLFEEGVGAELGEPQNQAVFDPLPTLPPVPQLPMPGQQGPIGMPPGAPGQPGGAPGQPPGMAGPSPPPGGIPGQLQLPPPQQGASPLQGGSPMPPGAPPGPPQGLPPQAAPGAPMGGGGPPGSNVIPFPQQGGQQPPPPSPQMQMPAIRGPVPTALMNSVGKIAGLSPSDIQDQVSPDQGPSPLMIVLTRIAKAIMLLRNDKQGFRIDIETDSTVQENAEQDKQDVMEFVKNATQFIVQAGQIVMMEPSAGPMLGKMLQWAVRRFRTGRDLEASIDDFVDQMEKNMKQQQANPRPNPQQIAMQGEAMKAQAEVQKAQIDGQSKMADLHVKHQETQMQYQKMQLDMTAQERKHQMDLQQGQAETLQKQQESEMKMKMMQMEMALKEREFDLKSQEIQQKTQMAQQQHEMQLNQTNMQMAMAQQQHQMGMQQNEKQGQLADQKMSHEQQMMGMEKDKMTHQFDIDKQRGQMELDLHGYKAQNEVAKGQADQESHAANLNAKEQGHKIDLDHKAHIAQLEAEKPNREAKVHKDREESEERRHKERLAAVSMLHKPLRVKRDKTGRMESIE